MIEFTKDPQNTIPSSLVKIIGLGGAGANMLDRVALDGMEGAEMLALNADIRTLSGSVAILPRASARVVTPISDKKS